MKNTIFFILTLCFIQTSWGQSSTPGASVNATKLVGFLGADLVNSPIDYTVGGHLGFNYYWKNGLGFSAQGMFSSRQVKDLPPNYSSGSFFGDAYPSKNIQSYVLRLESVINIDKKHSLSFGLGPSYSANA